MKFFSFSLDTGSSTLCTNLFMHHISMWVDSCNKFKIPITAAKAQEPVASYRMSKGQHTSQSNPPEYFYEAFVNAITEFIIEDDQVLSINLEQGTRSYKFVFQSLNVVENPCQHRISCCCGKNSRILTSPIELQFGIILRRFGMNIWQALKARLRYLKSS